MQVRAPRTLKPCRLSTRMACRSSFLGAALTVLVATGPAAAEGTAAARAARPATSAVSAKSTQTKQATQQTRQAPTKEKRVWTNADLKSLRARKDPGYQWSPAQRAQRGMPKIPDPNRGQAVIARYSEMVAASESKIKALEREQLVRKNPYLRRELAGQGGPRELDVLEKELAAERAQLAKAKAALERSRRPR